MLKRISLSFLCLFISFALLAQSQVTISGQIQNARGQIARVDFPASPLDGEIESHGGVVDSEGNFKIRFTLKEPLSARFYHGPCEIDMFIEPGDHIYMFFNTVNFGKSLRFSGSGAENNNLLGELFAKFEDPKLTKGQAMVHPMEYRYQSDRNRREKLELVQNHLLKHNVTREFAQYVNAKVEYGWAIDLFDYPFKYAMATSMDNVRNLSENYYSFMNDVSVYNDDVVDLPLYFEFLDNYLMYRFKQTYSSNEIHYESSYVKKYDFIKNELQGRPLYIALAKCLLDGLDFGKVEYLTTKYYDFIEINPYKEYNQPVIEAYEKASKVGAGRDAPSFNLRSLDGRMVSSENLKGKTLYIDFWATWCAPCISELPKSQKLKSQLIGTNIEFVYISVDDDLASWRSFIDRRRLTGIHLIIPEGFKSQLAKDYNLTAVPRYMIIDKHGTIVDSNAKKPSDPQLIEDLKLANQR